jgi:hypothetical protein
MLLSEDFYELGDQVLILLYHLFLRSGYPLVIVVSGRVACPDNKIYIILDVLVYPIERLVDESERRVAAGSLCAVYAGRPTLAMTCCLFLRTRVRLVEWIWVEVCMSSVANLPCTWKLAGLPVIWRNLPVSRRLPCTSLNLRLFSAAALGGAALAPDHKSSVINVSRVRGISWKMKIEN